MGKFSDDYFLNKFDRHAEGPERFKALAAHAALLLNDNCERDKDEAKALVTIRDALAEGVPAAKIVLAIQARLQEKFDTTGGVISTSDLPSA